MTCQIEQEEKTESDYVLHVKRPDGSIVKVLIPREDVDTYENDCVSQPSEPYGLNLICGGHYA